MGDVRCVVCAKERPNPRWGWRRLVAYGATLWVCGECTDNILLDALKLKTGGTPNA